VEEHFPYLAALPSLTVGLLQHLWTNTSLIWLPALSYGRAAATFVDEHFPRAAATFTRNAFYLAALPSFTVGLLQRVGHF
jgi:hypothetical protein